MEGTQPSSSSIGTKSAVSEGKQEQLPRPTLHFATRSKNGIKTFVGPPEIKELEVLSTATNAILQYSKLGEYLAIVDATHITIMDVKTNAIKHKIEFPNVSFFTFSPSSTFFVTWHRVNQEAPSDNLHVWNVTTGEVVFKLTQKNCTPELWPLLKFSEDDGVCARMVTNEVHFFGTKEFNLETKLVLTNISRFALSPNGRDSLKVASFVPEKKGAPGSAKVHRYPSMDVVCSKSFFKAQEADLLWNSMGSAVLIRTHTDMDNSGKSYYGETGLYYLQADGKFESNVLLKKEGPIYDCVWAPNGKEFLVIYGFMPAQATLFSTQCEPLIDFGQAHRNSAKFSPSGRVILIAGFGNLSGQMDFWDRKKVKKLGTAQAHTTSHFEWSPDGMFLLTAVLFPRMRIDNEFRIWNYDGSQVYREKSPIDLYQVNWKPIPASELPEYLKSPNHLPKLATKPAEPVAEAPKPGKYVHPNFSGRGGGSSSQRVESGPVKYSRQQAPPKPKQELPPGYDFEDDKKKNARKKKPKAKQETPPAQAPKPSIVIEEPDFGTSSGQSGVDAQKQIRLISKKLRQIDELKEQQKSGASLNKEQLDKLSAEASLRKELEGLSIN